VAVAVSVTVKNTDSGTVAGHKVKHHGIKNNGIFAFALFVIYFVLLSFDLLIKHTVLVDLVSLFYRFL
jgi:hypothetical protein